MDSPFELDRKRYQPPSDYVYARDPTLRFDQRRLARVVGFIAFGLPIILGVGGLVLGEFRDALSGYYYEESRGAIPEYDNKWNNAGWEGWLTYTPADNPQRLDKPLAIVHSESAAIPQGVQTFLAGFAGEATAQWLEGVTQFDFYHNPEDVTRAADTMAQHFNAVIGEDS